MRFGSYLWNRCPQDTTSPERSNKMALERPKQRTTAALDLREKQATRLENVKGLACGGSSPFLAWHDLISDRCGYQIMARINTSSRQTQRYQRQSRGTSLSSHGSIEREPAGEFHASEGDVMVFEREPPPPRSGKTIRSANVRAAWISHRSTACHSASDAWLGGSDLVPRLTQPLAQLEKRPLDD